MIKILLVISFIVNIYFYYIYGNEKLLESLELLELLEKYNQELKRAMEWANKLEEQSKVQLGQINILKTENEDLKTFIRNLDI